ncbi:MAG: O-succinylhomoserine sulfhydrylase [Gammaproteobacteria bacterium]|nr:O-succinylhomoserine sulfhydrylase [Gammaproteobacteria bacterium]
MADDNPNDWRRYRFATRAVRAGQHRTNEGENSEPIFATSSFVFANAAQAAARFAHEEEGNIYSRFTNPTVRTFEERLAALEGAEACVATSSGMAAILSMCLALLKAGDHVVSSNSIFGSTKLLFNNILARFGVDFDYVPIADRDAWQGALRKNTRLMFVETPGNPLTEIADLTELAGIARAAGVLLVVDNCFCTPALQRPLEMGADIVVHSATKYLDGQGRCVGGAVLGSQKVVGEEVYAVLRNGGATMSPFNAWVFLKGLETLEIRMLAVSQSAVRLAGWLMQQSAVEHVYYPGLPSHPQYALAQRQQRASGGIVSFDVRGGQEAAWRLIDSTRLLSITANLGDTKSTITHPATTTHGRWTPEQRAEAGIGDGLVRIAVGLEDVEDIQDDLQFH